MKIGCIFYILIILVLFYLIITIGCKRALEEFFYGESQKTEITIKQIDPNTQTITIRTAEFEKMEKVNE